ncbi:hypothetical protein [Arthrobacter pascens]|uniref:hypothetical protein n=1 Tax=Arthrobacter pascens TaxID=1677 RepID=UPI0027D89710|nr:hypothetical protein [Arthrobacter pascens]
MIKSPARADATFVDRLIDAADRYVDSLLETLADDVAALPHRAAMGRLLALLTVYTQPGSAHRGSSLLPAAMGACVARLEHLQGPAGLFDGTNLSSPPDSAFTINDACMTLEIAVAAGDDALEDVRRRLRAVVERVTGALLTGGVHTPNHRWELCAALARIHALLEAEGSPRPGIDARIAEWLAEGIDQLPDGMYSERSPLYATAVTNPSLVAIADSSGRPELLDHVRRNLTAFLPWFNQDGSVESLFSRRQDQWFTFQANAFMMLYRRLANQDGRADFAAAAAWLESMPLHEPAKLLALTRLDPWLREPLQGPGPFGRLPMPAALAPAQASLGSCGLHRFRRQGTVTTVFGGCDELVPGIVSGLSSNPTFLRLEHGAAALTDVRLSRSFFDLGPFRSQDTLQTDAGVSLSETVRANFYLPLPPEKRQPDGLYALEHEGRFSAGMDFGHRPKVEHRLATSIAVRVEDGGTVLDLVFDGADTSFALELTFRPGGVLEGVDTVAGAGTFQLVEGTGSYRVGSDVIEFGRGIAADPDNPPVYNPGEAYRYLGGTNSTDGLKVYITGRTRGTHSITLRGLSLPTH